MWGTFMGSGKKHMALAAVMAAANSSAGGAACSSKARRRRHGVIAGTCVPVASLGAASAHEAGSSSAERELSTSGALATGSGGVLRLSVVRLSVLHKAHVSSCILIMIGTGTMDPH